MLCKKPRNTTEEKRIEGNWLIAGKKKKKKRLVHYTLHFGCLEEEKNHVL